MLESIVLVLHRGLTIKTFLFAEIRVWLQQFSRPSNRSGVYFSFSKNLPFSSLLGRALTNVCHAQQLSFSPGLVGSIIEIETVGSDDRTYVSCCSSW